MSQIENSSSSQYNPALKAVLIVCALAVLVVISFGLALIKNQFSSIAGWTSYFWVSLISLIVLLGIWRSMEKEQPPRWLFYLVVAAALLRLAAGVFWSISLPRWGHATPAERGGYIMGDAAGRDLAAWKLAQSDSSLLNSFQNNRKVDQYGGLLFISALIYRYLGADFHQPWLVVLLGAVCSGLAVLFVWAFTRRIWDDSAARIAAWAMFLYPEAVLLGSSQMREAFTIPLAAASFYGLARYRDDHSPTSLAWMLVPVLFTAFFSPLSAAMLLGGLALAGLFLIRFGTSKAVQRSWFWLILGLLLVVGLAGLWFLLREVVPARITNPIAMLSWWLRKSASFQAYLSEHASGWMQKIFNFTPEWTHLPMLIAYGVVQPFLPAALIAGSEAPIWRFVAVWRSLGWTLLLAFLVYAPFHAFRRKEGLNLIRAFALVVWVVILVAAFRGGSDMWDNPRYRAIFAGIQVALSARIWVEIQQSRDPWLRRALLLAGAVLVWFLPWYLQRYYSIGWPVNNPFIILALGISTGALLILADWYRTARHKKPPSSS